MKLISAEQISKLNLQRLKSYLKRLRIENNRNNRIYYCDICNDYHFPSKMNEFDLKISKETKEIIKTKFFVKERILFLERK